MFAKNWCEGRSWRLWDSKSQSEANSAWSTCSWKMIADWKVSRVAFAIGSKSPAQFPELMERQHGWRLSPQFDSYLWGKSALMLHWGCDGKLIHKRRGSQSFGPVYRPLSLMRFRRASYWIECTFGIKFSRKFEQMGEIKLVNDRFNRCFCIWTALESSIQYWQLDKLTSCSWSIAHNFLLHSILQHTTLIFWTEQNEVNKKDVPLAC
jgi:hypothetical protein